MLGLRPITPNDEDILRQFFSGLSAPSRYQRFHCDRRTLTSAQVRYLSRADAEKHLAFLVAAFEAGQERMVAEVRCVALSAPSWQAEYAIVVDDVWQRQGIGRKCMQHLVQAAQAYGFRELVGDVLASNTGMHQFLKAQAFAFSSGDNWVCHSRLDLARLPANHPGAVSSLALRSRLAR